MGKLLDPIKKTPNKSWEVDQACVCLEGHCFSAAEHVTFWPSTNFALCFSLNRIQNGKAGFSKERSRHSGWKHCMGFMAAKEIAMHSSGLTSFQGAAAHTGNGRTIGAQLMPYSVKNSSQETSQISGNWTQNNTPQSALILQMLLGGVSSCSCMLQMPFQVCRQVRRALLF